MKLLKRVLTLVLVLAMMALPVAAWTERQNIFDWWRLRSYTAPAEIAQIATEDTLTSTAKKVFYVYYPEIDDRATFNTHCKGNEQTIVLGCYISDQGIYIFNVTDARLAGIKEVTAAHELLHAEYDRLSSSDKSYVDNLINQAYSKLQDQRIRSTIENYRKNGADVTNELHSILGTEVSNLSPELETYYERYFINRAAVVNYSERYEQVFVAQRDQVAQYDAQLDSLKQQINSKEASLQAESSSLSQQRSRLDALLAAGNYSAYNAGVDSYNSQVRQYNNDITYVKSLISQYNSIVATRNALASQEQELIQAMDSRSLPATK